MDDLPIDGGAEDVDEDIELCLTYALDFSMFEYFRISLLKRCLEFSKIL